MNNLANLRGICLIMENKINYKIIGERIRKIRRKQGMTQEKMSELINIEPSHISNIERAKTKVSFPTIMAIANALNASLDELAYNNLKKCSHVSFKNIDELLQDCTPEELVAIEQMIENTKKVLRSLQEKRD